MIGQSQSQTSTPSGLAIGVIIIILAVGSVVFMLVGWAA